MNDIQESVPASRSPVTGAGMFILKAGISAALIWYVLRDVPLSELWRRAQEADPLWLLLGLILLIAMTLLAAWRWWLVTSHAQAPLPFRAALRILLIGQFFNQTLPSSVGGDAFRVWFVQRRGHPIGVAIATVAADRLFGVLALVWTAALGALYALPRSAVSEDAVSDTASAVLPQPVFWTIMGLSVAGLGVIAILAFIGRQRGFQSGWLSLVGRVATAVYGIVQRLTAAIATLVLSIGVHLLVGLAAVAVFAAIGVTVHPGYVVAAVSIVMLVTVIPVSLGGWGVRETAMVVAFAPAGVAAADALLVSVALGLGIFVVGLPGGGLWLTRARPAGTLQQSAPTGTSGTTGKKNGANEGI